MTSEAIKDFNDATEMTPLVTESLPPLNPHEVIGSDPSGLDPEFNQPIVSSEGDA